jgi:hypothetical protein
VRVSFGDIGGAGRDVRHAGIYDSKGRTVAYGLLERFRGTNGSREIAFEPSLIVVRF